MVDMYVVVRHELVAFDRLRGAGGDMHEISGAHLLPTTKPQISSTEVLENLRGLGGDMQKFVKGLACRRVVYAVGAQDEKAVEGKIRLNASKGLDLATDSANDKALDTTAVDERQQFEQRSQHWFYALARKDLLWRASKRRPR